MHSDKFIFRFSVEGDTSEFTAEYEDWAKKHIQKLKAEQERKLAKAKKPCTSASFSSVMSSLILKPC